MSEPIYDLIDKNQLYNLLETFYYCINLPIRILNPDGNILYSFGEIHPYCKIFQNYIPTTESCSKLYANACKLSFRTGESSIFSCHSNLNHIVFPLLKNNVLLGSILVGPFLTDKPDCLILSTIGEKYNIPTDKLLKMYEESNNLPVITSSKVAYISRLLYFMCSGLITDSPAPFLIKPNKALQTPPIRESLQISKMDSQTNLQDYPYEKESALIDELKKQNAEKAKILLNDLLGYAVYSEENNLKVLKTRALNLCSFLSRAALEVGTTSDHILKFNNQLLVPLQNIQTLDDLQLKLQEAINIFADCMFNYVPTRNNELIKKAILYISKNFSQNLTLDDVAEHVHLNSAYFSALFKQSTGSSYKEYLNMVRIEESKRLLANTDHSLTDIALTVGFADQSYFTKVFKKYTGLTPKQYC